MDGDSAATLRVVKMEDATPSNAHGADSLSIAVAKDAGAAGDEPAKGKPYRSWKKKFHKLRVDFDVNMETNEKLHKEETIALQTTKRLAVEIDRILDLLLDINNTPQIPGSKRIDLSLPRFKSSPALDIDIEGGWERRFVDPKNPSAPPPEPAAHSLKALLADVPHLDLADTSKKYPSRLIDLIATDDNKLAFTPPDVRPAAKKQLQPQKKLSSMYPESFLTADDIDNYLWDTDRNVAGRAILANGNPPPMLPTMAPFAHTPDTHISHIGNGSASWEELFNRSIVESDLPKMVNTTPFWCTTNTIARNPTSVYNWLRDNAPKAIFLQEGEATAQAAAAAAAEKEKEKEANSGGADNYHYYAGGANGTGGSKRKSTGAGAVKKPRGGRVSAIGSTGARGGKRASGVTSAISREVFADDGPAEADLSDDLSPRNATSASAAAAAASSSSARGGKRKRTLDDDSGYRSKTGATASSSTRAYKRKRKSESGNADDDDADTSVLSATKKRQRKSDAGGDTEVEGGSDAGEPANEDVEVGDADHDGSSVEA
ncbi:hypothetical protein SCUCBS95973_001056 [Sporothrix curviconia]|uniref:Uncharacterized protein n=1 Tax=Sporothrix curviconia TaxID=1260050 RepID=A0ABP0AVH1_9PEZI